MMIWVIITLLVHGALVPLSCSSDVADSWRNRLLSASRSSRNTDLKSAGAAVGDGWVEMDAKIDMRAIVAILADIPEIKAILTNLTSKLERVDEKIILTAIIPRLTDIQGQIGTGFTQTVETIRKLIKSLSDGPLVSTEKKIIQIWNSIKLLNEKPLQCDLVEIKRGFGHLGNNIESKLVDLIKLESEELTKTNEELVIVKDNKLLIEKVLSALDGLNKRTSQAFGSAGDCIICSMLRDIYEKGLNNGNTLGALVQIVKNIPGDIEVLIKADEGLGGVSKNIIALLKIGATIKSGVDKLIGMVEQLTEKTIGYFTAHHKITIETSETIQEAALSVKKSASNAENASRRIARTSRKMGKCP